MEYRAKRLDRFLIHEQIVEKLGSVQPCIVNNYTSDHQPIILTWHHGDTRFGMPFKFNRVWLEDPKFEELVRAHWKRDRNVGPSPMKDILNRLQALKPVIKRWERKKKALQR